MITADRLLSQLKQQLTSTTEEISYDTIEKLTELSELLTQNINQFSEQAEDYFFQINLVRVQTVQS